jgi:hypothetical protein
MAKSTNVDQIMETAMAKGRDRRAGPSRHAQPSDTTTASRQGCTHRTACMGAAKRGKHAWHKRCDIKRCILASGNQEKEGS